MLPGLIAYGAVATAVCQWAIVVLIARAHGPQSVGDYSLLLNIATPVFLVGSLGLRNLYLTLNERIPWKTYVVIRAASLPVSILIYWTIVIAANLPRGLGLAILGWKVAQGVLDILYARLQKAGRVSFALISSATPTGTMLTIGLLAQLGASPKAVVHGATVVTILACIAALVSGPGPLTRPFQGPWTVGMGKVIQKGALVTGGQIGGVLGAALPIYFLSWTATPAEVGRYATAAYLVTLAHVLGAALQTIWLTSVASRFAPHRSYRRSIPVTVTLSVGAVLLVWSAAVLGPPVLEAIYGTAFRLRQYEVAPIALAALAVIPGYWTNTVMLVDNIYRTQLFVSWTALLSGGMVGLILNLTRAEDGIFNAGVVAAVVATLRWFLGMALSKNSGKAGQN